MVWEIGPRIGDCCHTHRYGWSTVENFAQLVRVPTLAVLPVGTNPSCDQSDSCPLRSRVNQFV